VSTRLTLLATALSAIPAASVARAEGPRVHVAAGAAHAVGTPQGREFGAGGGGTADLELPVTAALGAQAHVGALVLAKGESPSDPSLAPTSTGTAAFGAVGLRLRAWGARRPAGPWIDANAGVAQTGNLVRPVFDAHLGWDIRLSSRSRWDAGPFVGYTQIVQPSDDLRSTDARVLWAGLSVSLGAPARRDPAPATIEPTPEPPPPPPTVPDRDGFAEATDLCPGEDEPAPDDESCVGEVRIVSDRIVLGDVILFDFDSPQIRRQSERLVHKVAKVILETPDIQSVSIEGHADAIGTELYNKILSFARAESTRRMLISFGVPAERLLLVGHGKGHLKVQTERAHEGNRRVELVVLRKREVAVERTSARGAGQRGAP
jgi:OOP family OmpA-OmpF porin